jgi:hypothetical protein
MFSQKILTKNEFLPLFYSSNNRAHSTIPRATIHRTPIPRTPIPRTTIPQTTIPRKTLSWSDHTSCDFSSIDGSPKHNNRYLERPYPSAGLQMVYHFGLLIIFATFYNNSDTVFTVTLKLQYVDCFTSKIDKIFQIKRKSSPSYAVVFLSRNLTFFVEIKLVLFIPYI